MISSIFYNNSELKKVEAEFTTPLSNTKYNTCGLGFVDNAENLITAVNAAQVSRKMQRNVDVWSGNLRATGGKLEPTKTKIQEF